MDVAGVIWRMAQRLKPQEGWLPLLLLTAIVYCVTTAVREVAWVPEDGVVIPASLAGLLLGTVLAKRPISAVRAWVLILLYGALITLVSLSDLWPTWEALTGGWGTLRPYWLQNGALFLDRLGGWITAVFSSQSSQETLAFALGLGFLSYLLIAFACWQVFRRYRPFAGLVVLGLGLAFNGYFGGGQIWWLGAFVGLTAVLTAVTNFYVLATNWDTKQVDYSDEVRTDLFVYALVIAAFLLGLALGVPNVSIKRLAQQFQEQPVVQQTEAALERIFGGVEAGSSQPQGQDGVGGAGILPRSFLLDAPPELFETVVMTAEVKSEANLAGVHWRALSYDVYTGRGWALSEERTERIDREVNIPLPPALATGTISQTVYWHQDDRLARYTLGLPRVFDQPVETIWRGQADLVRVNGIGRVYIVESQISQATPNMLRETAVADVPPALLARYTSLPESVPQRVHDLAEEIVTNHTNPYDQARAIEQFLRQYPYSLDVESPPSRVDTVDHFLFDLQTGYCDFYASAMVVLARSVGLPARLAVGYLAQPPDEADVQTVYQINGHSWAELYFAGFGWVEFEPTAAFDSPHSDRQNTNEAPAFAPQMPEFGEPQSVEPPPMPTQEPERPFPWATLLVLGLLSGIGVWLWQRGRLPAGADAAVWSFGRWQQQAGKLGHPPEPSQTPNEFLAAFEQYLDTYDRFPRLAKRLEKIRPHLTNLTGLYIQQRYAGRVQSGQWPAWTSWQQIKWPLWLLRIVRIFATSQ